MKTQTGSSLYKKASPIISSLMIAAIWLAGCTDSRKPGAASTSPPIHPTSALLAYNSTPGLYPSQTPALLSSSTLLPSLTPTATATPYPLPSEGSLKARFEGEVQPLVIQLKAAAEQAGISLDPDVQVILVPENARLHYVQSILQFDRSPAIPSDKTAYVLYSFSRGEILGYSQNLAFGTTTETQEISTHLRLIVVKNGQFHLIESVRATGSEGSTSFVNLVENALLPFEKLSGANQTVKADLKAIIGYACGIDMLPSLDYPRKVALLTHALGAEEWAARRQAAQMLGLMDPPPVSSASALIALLSDQAEVRIPAGETLRNMAGDPQVYDLLLAALSDPQPAIRQSAAVALSSLEATPTDLFEPFLILFYDEAPEVRQVAATWMSYTGGSAVVPEMIAALADNNSEIRRSAAEVLHEHAAQASQAVPDLTRLLLDSNPDVRREAARTLGAIGDPARSALPELVKAAGNEGDSAAFPFLVEAISALSSKADALPILRQALDRDDPLIRSAACDLLATYPGVPGALEILASAVNDQDDYVRRDAFTALEEFGSEARQVLPALMQIAEATHDYDEFKAVLTAIGAIGGRAETLPFLQQSLASEAVAIRRAACDVLAGYEDIPGAKAALTPALQDVDETVRLCAAGALARINDQPASSLDELIQTAQHETDPDIFYDQVRNITILSGKPAAFPVLTYALAGDNAEIRAVACGILAQYVGIPGAVELLIPPLSDVEPSVRAAAARSLVEFGSSGSSALPGLKTAVEQESDRQAYEAEIAAIAAVAGPAEALPLIQATLASGPADRRVAATGALKACPGAPGAIELLISLMHDGDARVRESAISSIYYYGAEGKKAVPDLISALSNPQDYYIYIGAAITLGGIGPEASPATPALVHMLQTAGDLEKQYPLSALAKIGPDAGEAVPALVEFLNAVPPGPWADTLLRNCLEALNSITLENFGDDIDKWNAWWALNKDSW